MEVIWLVIEKKDKAVMRCFRGEQVVIIEDENDRP